VERRTLSAKVVERSLGMPLMATVGIGFGEVLVVGAEKGLEKGLVLPVAGVEKGFTFTELAGGELTPNMLLPRVDGAGVVESFA